MNCKVPALSIIIPTLNCEGYVKNLSNSFGFLSDNVELIFIDGLSADNTLSSLSSHFPFAKIYSRYPRGIYDAYNFGVSVASGRYMLFLGADDLLNTGLLIVLDKIHSLKKYPSMIVCQSIIFPKNATTIHKRSLFNLISTNFCHQSILYLRSTFPKSGYDLRFNVMSDWVMNIDIYGFFGKDVEFYNEVISTYSLNGYSGRSKDPYWSSRHYMIKIRKLNPLGIILYFIKTKLFHAE